MRFGSPRQAGLPGNASISASIGAGIDIFSIRMTEYFLACDLLYMLPINDSDGS